MIHYTCDLCGRSLNQERYEAKIEVAPAFDPEELTQDDLSVDHLQQIADEISEMETTGDFELDDTGSKTLRLDFCSCCAQKFVKSPLNLSANRRVSYSNN